MSARLDGRAEPGFEGVADAFARTLERSRGGAAFAVVADGRLVVDLWGGTADARTGRAWERDTACPTFSCTKAVTATAALRCCSDAVRRSRAS